MGGEISICSRVAPCFRGDMTKHKKEHKGSVLSKQIFYNADANANANVVADAEIVEVEISK